MQAQAHVAPTRSAVEGTPAQRHRGEATLSPARHVLLCLLSAALFLLAVVGVNLAFARDSVSARDLKFESLTRCRPEVLILGSSRSMRIRPATVRALTGRSAFNAAVDSALVEDFVALAERAPGKKEILLGVDLEAFHNQWSTDPGLLELTGTSPWGARASRLLSLSNAWTSFQGRGQSPEQPRFGPDGGLEPARAVRGINRSKSPASST